MKINDLKCKVRHVNEPIQPFIEASTLDFQKRLTRLNPLTEKEGGMFYQFHTPQTKEPFIATFIPDGCVNMIFRCDQNKPASTILGIFEEAHSIELRPDTQYFGVIPYSGFLGIKAWKALPTELHDHQYDLADVIGNEALCETISGLESFDERVLFFKNYFMDNLVDQDYYNTLSGILSLSSCCASGNISVEQIGELSGYSYSYCRKSFMEHFGVSVKRYSKAVRFSQAVSSLLKDDMDKQDIVSLALKTGFYDESHFIHEFKQYTGFSPLRFVKRVEELNQASKLSAES